MTAGHEGTVNLWAAFWETLLSQDEIKSCKKVFYVGHAASFFITLFITILYTVPNKYRASLWEAAEDSPIPWKQARISPWFVRDTEIKIWSKHYSA